MASTQQRQAAARQAKKSSKQPTMNTYQVSVDQDPTILKQWLNQNGCPKAAASVKAGDGFKSTYTMSGNVSTLSQMSVFEKIRVRYEVTPIGNSEPLSVIVL